MVVLVSPATQSGATIADTADVTAATFDPDLANNSQTVTTNVLTQADVLVSKTTAASPVFAGNPVAYTITVSNAGPSDAQTVVLSDVVPPYTTFVSNAQTSGPAFSITSPAAGSMGTISGTIGTLAAGVSASFTVVVLVPANTSSGTTIANTADVTAATYDSNLANNSQTVTTNVLTQADVSVTKSTTFGPGCRWRYRRLHDDGFERWPEQRPERSVDRSGAGQHHVRLGCAELGTCVQFDQSGRGRDGHNQRHDRHAGLGRLGSLHRRAPGVGQHAGWNDDRQHGQCGRCDHRSRSCQQQPNRHD